MSEVSYIHDGYTEAGYIEAEPNLYPACRFVFRPMLQQNRAVIFDRITKSDPRKQEMLAAQAIVAQVSVWDIKMAKSMTDGELLTVPLTPASVLRLKPSLANRLYRIVTGLAAYDDDPEATDAERDARAAEDEAAALAGKGPEETTVKNLPEAPDS